MKKIIVLLFVFLCCGCSSIKYSVRFGEKISEEVNLKVNVVNSDMDEEVGFYMSPFQSFFRDLPYKSIEEKNGDCKATKEFESINDFINNSFVFTKLFDKNIINVDNSKVKINIDVAKYPNVVNKLKSSPIEISFYIPYHVSSHNADSVSNNTYIWKINNLEKASIKIDFDMSKSYKYKNNSIYVYIIISISVIILGVIIYLFMRNKKVNKI